MNLRLRTLNDVRKFASAITLIALVGNLLLQYLLLPPELFERIIWSGSAITVMLAGPISYFVGAKMRDVIDLTEQLEHAVNHDNLTGTCTRLSFYQRLAPLQDTALILIVTDIDHFKKINDRYGHQAGDAALKQFANTLVRNCREEDVVARFGGEEFIIVLREVTLEEGAVAAQRLCDRVREKTFVAEGQTMQMTASFGVTEVSTVSEIDDAIHRADLAAFRAKRDGRDRVCVYDPALDETQYHGKAAE